MTATDLATIPFTTVWADSKRDATTVALLIGLNLVADFDDLPTGFKQRWRDAFEAGAFIGKRTLGGMKVAFCNHLCRETEDV